MMMFISTIIVALAWAKIILAHEEGAEITNLAQADWIGPLVAIIVIAGAIIVARAIRARSNAN